MNVFMFHDVMTLGTYAWLPSPCLHMQITLLLLLVLQLRTVTQVHRPSADSDSTEQARWPEI